MLRQALAREGRRRIKFSADSGFDPLDLDRLHVARFALRLLTWNFFDLAVEPFIGNHFEVRHERIEPDAILTAGLNVDQELVLAWLPGVPGDGEGVCSRIKMKGNESTRANVRQSLRTVKEPSSERLPASWKETCRHVLHRIARSVEGDGGCLGQTGWDKEQSDQNNTEKSHHC